MEINQLQPTFMTFWTSWKKPLFPERSVRVLTEAEIVKVRHISDLRLLVIVKCGNGSWQSNSFLMCLTNMCPGCYVKFQIEKHWLMKHFAFLKNVCYQYLNFVLWVTYCFLTTCWLAHNQLSWTVLLFSVIWLVNFVYRWPWLQYSRLPIIRTFMGNRKKFELSGVRVIEGKNYIQNDLMGNENCFELAEGSRYRGLELLGVDCSRSVNLLTMFTVKVGQAFLLLVD